MEPFIKGGFLINVIVVNFSYRSCFLLCTKRKLLMAILLNLLCLRWQTRRVMCYVCDAVTLENPWFLDWWKG